MVEEARKIHDLYPTSLAALGRTMTMGAIMAQMYKVMDSTVQRSGMFGGGAGENVFREMLNQEYARNAAYGDAYGLGEMIYQAMKVRANAAPAAPAPAAASPEQPKEE